jgi:D-3-phosphoglycerate dehydrogenase
MVKSFVNNGRRYCFWQPQYTSVDCKRLTRLHFMTILSALAAKPQRDSILFKILLTDYPWPDVSIESRIFAEAGAELVVAPNSEETTLADLASSCDAILACWAQVTRRVIESAPRCRIVSRMGIGLDNIDLDCCREFGILVTNVPDYCVQEVAEHALASIFALGRNIGRFHLATKQGDYDLSAAPVMFPLNGATLGIIGMGRIGSRTADLADAVGMNVIVAERPSLTCRFRQHTLEELARQSDYVSLHVPLSKTTYQMINAEFLAVMKTTAFLINTSRGALVDHAALADALNARQIAGAALDVQDPEPPNLEIVPFNLPQVIVTPHAAFVSDRSLATLRQTACEQALQALRGERPDNTVIG